MVCLTNEIEIIYELDGTCFGQDCYSLKQYEDMLNSNVYNFYLIKEIDKNIGFIILQKQINNEYELIKTAIASEYQHQGFAFKNLNELIKILDYESIFLEVSSNNNRAISLYNKLGFKQISVRKEYYKDKSNAIIMIKQKY